MKSVYLLLTRSGTVLSRLIRMFTGDEFTHVAITADETLRELYSFSRKYSRLPLPAGFTCESVYGGYISRHPFMKCALYELTVSEETYSRICGRITVMNRAPGAYRYSLLGVLFCAFGREYTRRRYYFCSQFVGELLNRSGALCLPKAAGLMHPDDYRTIPELTRLYGGDILGLLRFMDERQCIRAAS